MPIQFFKEGATKRSSNIEWGRNYYWNDEENLDGTRPQVSGETFRARPLPGVLYEAASRGPAHL
jgi:hypothetical protein